MFMFPLTTAAVIAASSMTAPVTVSATLSNGLFVFIGSICGLIAVTVGSMFNKK